MNTNICTEKKLRSRNKKNEKKKQFGWQREREWEKTSKRKPQTKSAVCKLSAFVFHGCRSTWKSEQIEREIIQVDKDSNKMKSN